MIGRVLVRAWLVTTGLLYAWYLVTGAEVYRVDVAIIDGEMVTAAHWLRDNLPAETRLAVHDVGAVGYFAPRPVIDIAGLITPEIIPALGQPQALWEFLYNQDAAYLLAFPDQIPGGSTQDARLCPVYSTEAAITQRVGQSNMTLYRLAWDERC